MRSKHLSYILRKIRRAYQGPARIKLKYYKEQTVDGLSWKVLLTRSSQDALGTHSQWQTSIPLAEGSGAQPGEASQTSHDTLLLLKLLTVFPSPSLSSNEHVNTNLQQLLLS